MHTLSLGELPLLESKDTVSDIGSCQGTEEPVGLKWDNLHIQMQPLVHYDT